MIAHNVSHAFTKKESFERLFLQNCSAFVFCFGNFPDTRLIQLYLRDCVDFSTKDTKEVMQFVTKLMLYPYIYLTNRQFRNNLETRIRFDIFGKNLMLFRRFKK